MENFCKSNKLFFSIIIGAVIIGGFVYFVLKNPVVVVAPKTELPITVQNSAQSVTTKQS